jgi:hypothetical protein
MAQVPTYTSLAELQTSYSRFEKDQVLTHEQLNSVADFADDQVRLTRVRLLGVGIVCGLRVRLTGSTVTISRGVGVTTDGDVLALEGDTAFDRYKPYDASHPVYPPFYKDGDVTKKRVDVYQLVAAADAEDPAAQSLGGFGAAEEHALADMTALMLMESYVMDPDLCTGTDCDNLGQEVRHAPRILLVDRASAAALREELATPNDAFAPLAPLIAGRPVFPANLVNPGDLAVIYQKTCANTNAAIMAALPALEKACSALLGDALPAGTAKTWVATLKKHQAGFTGAVQYYYDFLRDLVETLNELRDRLFDDTTVCVPAEDGFAKHLLLGDLTSGAVPPNRTGFYPSPLVSRTAGALDEARELARRIGAMIESFGVDAGIGTPIVVTPSADLDRPLGDRAIPFYYQPGGNDPPYTHWNYRLTRRGMQAYNYSYHAASWGAQGGAANPLASQIGGLPFFRIEGHVGKNVTTARLTLEGAITASNLPFTVQAVLLDNDRTKVVRPSRDRFTDLHHLHYLIRQDLAQRLDEVESFSDHLTDRVNEEVASGHVDDKPEETGGVSVRTASQQQKDVITQNAPKARTPLRKSYAEYRKTPVAEWQEPLRETVRASGTFKTNVGPVSRTSFNSPLDSLVATPHINWLPWIDRIIDDRNAKDDERLLFRKFAAENSALEHFGGVRRGGTFVLVYDANNTVIADFMLPYYVSEPSEEPVEPKKEDLPDIRPIFPLDQIIQLLPSRVELIKRKIDDFAPIITQQIDQKVQLQDQKFNIFKDTYLNVVKESVDLVKSGVGTKASVPSASDFNDKVLGSLVADQQSKQLTLEQLQKEAERPDVTPDRRELVKKQITETEADLAATAKRTAEYIDKSGAPVDTGTEGFAAMLTVVNSVNKMTDARAIDSAKAGLSGVLGVTQNTGLKTMIGNMRIMGR